MTRRDKEATRRLLLETGYEMILEQGLDAGWGVRITDVTKRVGLTTGAAYQIWHGSRTNEGLGGQDRYHHDLAVYAFNRAIADASNYSADRAWDQVDEGASLDLILQRLGQDVADARQAHARFAVFLALVASAGSDPELGSIARGAYQGATDHLVGVYRKVFEHCGLEVVEPYTMEQLITSVLALIDGLRMRALVDPEITTSPVGPPPDAADDADGTWYLVSSGVQALIGAMTRPVAG